MNELLIRGILGVIIFAFAMFCFIMAANNIFATVAFIWLAGFNTTYIVMVHRYMKKYEIQDIRKASEEHQSNANQLFLNCLIQWPSMWVEKGEKQ